MKKKYVRKYESKNKYLRNPEVNPNVPRSVFCEYIKAAKELCYPKEVLDRMCKAKDEIEIENIMHDARFKV